MLQLRDSISTAELDLRSSAITVRLLSQPEIKNAKAVSIYLHTGSEVRTNEIIDWLLSHGKHILVPITDKSNGKLIFSELRDPKTELEPATFGILEPKPEFRRPVPLEQASLIIVPGIVWDILGYRIGYGGGYYDRSINSLHARVPLVGIAYEIQLLKRIPVGRYDRPVDKLVTEQRLIVTQRTST